MCTKLYIIITVILKYEYISSIVLFGLLTKAHVMQKCLSFYREY